MDLRKIRNYSQLASIFRAAAIPEPREFKGCYTVDILWGPLPNLKGWRKLFMQPVPLAPGEQSEVGEKVHGCNLTGDNTSWGWFILQPTDVSGEITIDYNRPVNYPRFLRRVRDEVRQVAEGLYLGRFCIEWVGKRWFIAWFALQRTTGWS